MIKIMYLADCEGAEKYGTCASCEKDSGDDSLMIRAQFFTKSNVNKRTSICLCDECRKLLYKTI